MPVINLTSSRYSGVLQSKRGGGPAPRGLPRYAPQGLPLARGQAKSTNPKGARTWNFDYWNRDDVHRRVSLGRSPGLSPDGARKLALKAAADVSGGTDVYAERRATKEAADKAKSATLAAFMQRHYKPWATSHLKSGAFAISRIEADFGTGLPAR